VIFPSLGDTIHSPLLLVPSKRLLDLLEASTSFALGLSELALGMGVLKGKVVLAASSLVALRSRQSRSLRMHLSV